MQPTRLPLVSDLMDLELKTLLGEQYLIFWVYPMTFLWTLLYPC